MSDGEMMDGGGRIPLRWVLSGSTELDDGAIIFEEFEEGDPRRGPHSLEKRAEAAAYLAVKDRWHLRDRGVDWLAIRLQFGRGFCGQVLARRFGVGDSRISSRKRDEKWAEAMSERDRRRLSRLVWLGGLLRGAGDNPESRDRLKASSAWDWPEEAVPLRFIPDDLDGAPQQATFNEEISNGRYGGVRKSNDDEYLAMCRSVDEIVARMERDVAGGAESRREEVVPEVAEGAGGTEEVAAAEEVLEAVGAAEPASA